MPDTITFNTFATVVILEFCFMALWLVIVIDRGFKRAFRYLGEKTALKEELSVLQDFVRDCRDNWDCDEDAHEHGTPCRVCRARSLLVDNILEFDCKAERSKSE